MLTRGSVFDLAAIYTLLFVDREINEQEHKSIINSFNYILSRKYTYIECVNIMLSQMTDINKKKAFKIKNILSFTSTQSNMLEQNKIYYHKELRVQVKPHTIDFDYNTGDMVSTKTEFFVEMAASYTMNELIEYLLSFNYIDTKQWQSNRLIGLIKFYINKYGLDTVLFMIEAVSNNIDDKYFDFNKFDNYYQIALGYMNNIKNNCKSNGGDKIVPRKRIQFSGSGVWL